MNRRLVVGSHNRGKVAEIAQLLRGLPLETCSLDAYPAVVLPEETGESFAENAELKARAVAEQTGEWSVADDSGLMATALGGAPGVRSARVAADDPARIAWLLAQMEALPEEQRAAEFVCALALAEGSGKVLGRWEGRVRGRILREPRGHHGFGYDPVFLHEPSRKTFAEMTREEKSAVSHRGQALRQLRDWLAGQLAS